MKIIFFGDSATDANRQRGSAEAGRIAEEFSDHPRAYGAGYVALTAAQLLYEKPNYYQILNRGIGGDRLPQLYARIQLDVWNENPDVLNILVGGNDLPREKNPNPTDFERWARLYRLMLQETQEKCPNTKIILCEPFAWTKRPNTDGTTAELVRKYAAEAKKIAEEFGLPFVSLQEKMDEAAEIYDGKDCYYDGVHTNLVGSMVMSKEWMKVFKEQVLPQFAK